MMLFAMLVYQDIDIAVLVLVALVYAIYDVFNKRNVPNFFVYITIVIGVALAVMFNSNFLALDFGIASVVGLIGYAFYRSGLLGGGDVLEFVFIALVMPVQIQPFLGGPYQFNIPFILSVLIAAGYTSLIFIPAYYLGVKKPKKDSGPDRRGVAVGALFFVAYMALIMALKFTFGISLLGALLVLVLAVMSAITMAYEKRVYLGMVSFIYPKQLEEGDMIATNLMDRKDVAYFKNKTTFGRLATAQLISDLKSVRKRIPVYRDSVPFSLFIFIGIIVSLLFGNIILAIMGI
ncbi:MAG: hypothetical protein ACYCO0_00760 [Candidatus Micrarchaeaceae archaeon]